MPDPTPARRTGALCSPDDPIFLFAPSQARFADRHDAGMRLARLLTRFRDEHPVVVGMPRGGVPVAAEVALALDAPLDVVVVRKIGAPGNPEYALGAVAEDGTRVLSEKAVHALGLSDTQVQDVVAEAERELAERTRRLRAVCERIDLTARTAILVDDGLATGRSARAALRSLRGRGAARVILAVPVAAPESVAELREEADEIVCVEMPEDLWAIGFWYEDFRPTTDEEVAAVLSAQRGSDVAGGAGAPAVGATDRTVER